MKVAINFNYDFIKLSRKLACISNNISLIQSTFIKLRDALMLTDTPFRSWDRKQLAVWLDRQGLGQYDSCLPSSINGAALVDAGPHHFEKILGMKNHLHRKKLILAIRSKLSSRPNPVDHIDHNWVIRWLDDIGLPQHKESFAGNHALYNTYVHQAK